MKNTTIEQLERQIEQLIREHIAACRQRAADAVERAFETGRALPTRPRNTAMRPTTGRRRPPDEMTALAERLYQAICARPGASMAVLAPALGSSSRLLNRPVRSLKRAGRVRSVGLRQETRYFPMAQG